MRKEYKLSIITICYNEPNVERTCESIVNQTWQDFEWIVIDGGSNSGTLKILSKYKKRMNYFVSEPDKGIYNAMNKGIKQAHGEYLLFLNAGDNLHADDVLQKAVEAGLKEDIVGADCKIVEQQKSYIVIQPEYFTQKYLIESSLYHPSTFIKKRLFDKYGLYNENYKIVSDWEKWIIFLKNGCSYSHLNLTLSDFYVGGISSTPEIKTEHQKVLEQYFFRKEIRKAWEINTRYKLFGFILLFKISYSANSTHYYLLSLPLLKVIEK